MGKDWQVLYYSKKDGSLPVKDYIDALALRERAKVMAFIGLLEDRGPDLPRPYADLLTGGIHELRIKLTGTQVRILYFFCYQNTIVLTNLKLRRGSGEVNRTALRSKDASAFEKQSDKVPEASIKTAKESREDFLSRVTENDIRGKNETQSLLQVA